VCADKQQILCDTDKEYKRKTFHKKTGFYFSGFAVAFAKKLWLLKGLLPVVSWVLGSLR
jgi:hypothetical protein